MLDKKGQPCPSWGSDIGQEMLSQDPDPQLFPRPLEQLCLNSFLHVKCIEDLGPT